MADKNLLAQMLENLVNNDQAKAEELFHEYVVAKSREIYEDLIESEIEADEEVDEATDEEDKEEDKVDEASDDEDKEEDKVDEEFEDVAFEAEPAFGGDATDDLEGELDGDHEGEEGEAEEGEEQLFQDLEAIVDELQAKFDELKGIEGEEHGDEFGSEEGEEDETEEGFGDGIDAQLATVREYVEKVPAGHGAEKKGAAEKADNTKSTIDNMKNDMGGTTANILSSKEDAGTYAGAGQLKGNGLLKGSAKEDNAGNINVPGAKNGNAFSKKEPGHGAEKKGAAETADNKQSLFRGRR